MLIIGGFLALLALLIAFAQGNASGESGPGHAAGTAFFIGLVTLGFWKLGSPRSGAIALLVASLLSTCSAVGRAGISTENQRVNDVVSSALVDAGLDPDDQTFRVTRSEGRCLEDLGIDNNDMVTAVTDTSQSGLDAQSRFLDATLICMPRIVEDDVWIEQMRSSFSIGVATEVSRAEMVCLVEYAIETSEHPGDIMLGEDLDGLLAGVEACFSEDVLAFLRRDPGSGPQNYGDDPRFDQLHDLCVGDSDTACDILYTMSSFESEYSLLATDCAGRGVQAAGFCVAEVEDNDLDGFADDTSPGLIDAVAGCEAGDMVACDFVLAVSEMDSQYLGVAKTCGGRDILGQDTCLATHGEYADN